MVRKFKSAFLTLSAAALPAIFAGSLLAQPTVLGVPFQASTPAVPHTSWSGNPVTIKGTATIPGADAGHSFTFDIDPGDGGTHCTGTPTVEGPDSAGLYHIFALACPHTYSGSVGQVFTAVITVNDTSSSTSGSAQYFTKMFAPTPNLPVEVNNAIDNGLWYMHTHMNRNTTGGVDYGNWNGGSAGNMNTAFPGPNGSNCNAFEVSGFLQQQNNPYADDVRRCLNNVLATLSIKALPSGTITIPDPTNSTTPGLGTITPDQNSNGVAIMANQYPENYQTGMAIDALVSSGTPTFVVPSGITLSGSSLPAGTGPAGAYTFKDAVFDMVDYYAYCQTRTNQDNGFNGDPYFGAGTLTVGGGWQYSCGGNGGDNSASQWGAIGIIPAARQFGAVYNSVSKASNAIWLTQSFDATNHWFGYQGPNPIWGPYADTPSGMVQMAMDGYGRGSTLPGGVPAWDQAETFMRDNFANTGSATVAPKSYLYGLFSFTKAMLLHDNTLGTGTPTPLSTLHSSNLGPTGDIDWYAAQTSSYGGSDPTDGVARHLVGLQGGDGSWYGTNYTSEQYPLETGIAITMLNRTVFQPVPVACATFSPNPVANGGPVQLDGSCSVDQNAPSTNLVSWQWNTSGDGTTNFNVQPGNAKCQTATCVKMSQTFSKPANASFPYSYPVRLRVTNNANPALTADVVFNVIIATPPTGPTSVVGGPYSFCPAPYTPWQLDGSHSSNPDDGQHETNAPPSMITSFAWDFNGQNTFTGASGALVDVTSAFASRVGTSFNISLKVTNNDNVAFPSANLNAGLFAISSTTVTVHNPTDAECAHCVVKVQALPKAGVGTIPSQVQLYWTDTNSGAFAIDHYNIYRSTSAGFADLTKTVKLAGSGAPKAGVPASAGGSQLVFTDTTPAVGTQYYYRISPATANDTETCGSPISIPALVPRGR